MTSLFESIFRPRKLRQQSGKTALITATFGGVDALHVLPPHEGIDSVLFVDQAGDEALRPEIRESWGQVVVPNFPRHDFSPRLRSRYFKHQINRLELVEEHEFLVWADGTLRFKELGFVTTLKNRMVRDGADVVVVPHPDRASAELEYEYIRREMDNGNEYLKVRYAHEKMDEQMAYLRRRGLNTRDALYCGTFWMIRRSPAVHECWNEWWDHNLRFGMMDQLSLPGLMEAKGLRTQLLDVPLWDNAHFSYVAHQAPCAG